MLKVDFLPLHKFFAWISWQCCWWHLPCRHMKEKFWFQQWTDSTKIWRWQCINDGGFDNNNDGARKLKHCLGARPIYSIQEEVMVIRMMIIIKTCSWLCSWFFVSWGSKIPGGHFSLLYFIILLWSYILNLSSYISYLWSYILYLSSYILYLWSYILYFRNYILYLWSYILYSWSYLPGRKMAEQMVVGGEAKYRRDIIEKLLT